MKCNYEFVMREVAGEHFLVPIGEAARVFDGIITINELGAFIFECAPDCANPAELAARIASAYDTDAETVLADVTAFFAALREAGIVFE